MFSESTIAVNPTRRRCSSLARGTAIFLVAAFFYSCTTVGNKTIDDPSKYLNVREGQSTKLDIYTIFGQPHDVEYAEDGARSLWTYFKVEMRPNGWSYVPYVGLLAGGTNEDSTKVYFFFDANARLVRTQTNKKEDSENSWAGIARMASQGKRDDRAKRVAEEMVKVGKPFDGNLAHKVKFVQ